MPARRQLPPKDRPWLSTGQPTLSYADYGTFFDGSATGASGKSIVALELAHWVAEGRPGDLGVQPGTDGLTALPTRVLAADGTVLWSGTTNS